MNPEPCPCGRSDAKGRFLALTDCCAPLHQGESAPDAERLMRSRYSAFVLGLTEYLLRTWHASTRPESVEWEPAAQWLGLEIKDHQITSADSAEVTFVARFRVAGRAVRQHERSRFVHEGGRWWYVDGDVR
ncbi:MAG: hypothetical protein RJB34_945 [Pseudomonadota bacterium]